MLKKLTATGVLAFAVTGAAMAAAAPANAGTSPNPTINNGPVLSIPILNCSAVPVIPIISGGNANCVGG